MHPALEIPAGGFDAYAWPGGYPILYYTRDGETVCAKCASREVDNQQAVIQSGIHWEGPAEICADCGVTIESAYGDPDATNNECPNPGRYCKCEYCQNVMADIAYDRMKEGD